jgi:hypothetical protein
MSKRTWLILMICLSGLSFFLASSQAQDKSEVWTRTLSIDPAKEVYFSFQDVDGDLKVVTQKEPEIKIKVTKEALTRDKRLASRLLAGTKIRLNQRNNRFELEILYPRLKTFLFPFRDYRRIKVSTEISLPQGANLKANLVDGRASLTGKFKEIEVTTVDGPIWLENIEGKFKLNTVDGRVTISQGRGEAEIVAVDGDITIEGEIEPLKIQTTDGDIRAELASGTKIHHPWQLRTVDGDIEISLPPDLSADLDLETIDGSIRCDLKMSLNTIRGMKKISGRLNLGGPLISLKTVDGRIWLREKKAP